MQRRIISLTLALIMVLSSMTAIFTISAGAEGSSVKKNKKGDVNDNGEIDSTDYLLAKRAYFGTYALDEEGMYRADANDNGSLDSMDYILIKRAYFGTYELGGNSGNEVEDDSIYQIYIGYNSSEISNKEQASVKNARLVEERILYYINQYRIDEGKPKLIMLDGKARDFARKRSEQLFYNCGWSDEDRYGLQSETERRELATELKFGKLVKDETGDYYEPYGEEVDLRGSYFYITIDNLAKKYAEYIRARISSWRTSVGNAEYKYCTVGVSLSIGGRIAVCVVTATSKI